MASQPALILTTKNSDLVTRLMSEAVQGWCIFPISFVFLWTSCCEILLSFFHTSTEPATVGTNPLIISRKGGFAQGDEF